MILLPPPTDNGALGKVRNVVVEKKMTTTFCACAPYITGSRPSLTDIKKKKPKVFFDFLLTV